MKLTFVLGLVFQALLEDVAVNNGVVVTKHRLIILNVMFILHEAATCTHTSFLLAVKHLHLHIDPFFVTV